jgi:hypothetical protein
MMWTLLHRRDDNTFVIRLTATGWNYHVTADDPLFPAVGAAAEGADLPPEPVPEPLPSASIVLTNRQLFAALALTGFITEVEALAAGRTGAVPALVDAVFASLPAQDAFLARLTWATMREVPRNHPLISAMVDANLATSEQVDGIFALGASLP